MPIRPLDQHIALPMTSVPPYINLKAVAAIRNILACAAQEGATDLGFQLTYSPRHHNDERTVAAVQKHYFQFKGGDGITYGTKALDEAIRLLHRSLGAYARDLRCVGTPITILIEREWLTLWRGEYPRSLIAFTSPSLTGRYELTSTTEALLIEAGKDLSVGKTGILMSSAEGISTDVWESLQSDSPDLAENLLGEAVTDARRQKWNLRDKDHPVLALSRLRADLLVVHSLPKTEGRPAFNALVVAKDADYAGSAVTTQAPANDLPLFAAA